MASWSELLHAFNKNAATSWLDQNLIQHLKKISEFRGGATVLFYASAFLQKPDVHDTAIAKGDINGFMNALYKRPTDKGLVLILHTPGGDLYAVESIVEYLHAKFEKIQVVVPYLAMSGGAMNQSWK